MSVEVLVLVVVVGDFDFRFGTINSSHRRSCKPVRNGSFPLDFSESENERPGDLRTTAPSPGGAGFLGGIDVGGARVG